MLVRDVLESKGRRILTIDCEATVSEAIAKLVQNNIGSLPVVDENGHLIGIFSERDVLRLIHNRGEGFGRLRVCDVMTRDPVTCHLDDDVDEVMGKMSERRIAKVPVTAGQELVGIVSVGDVVKALHDKLHTENQQLMSYIHGSI
ncbi:MAG TPA: CBS domain-containing protein [Isosphaeraceae bacterium]|nr:CBS domain-containing protein [Isosphaeraceae bacterium]